MEGLACEPRVDDQVDDPLTGVVTPPPAVEPPAQDVQSKAAAQFEPIAALMGGMQAALTDQGEQLKATMKEGELAHERRQEEFAGVVKEQFKASAKETTQLVEGVRVEVAAAQQETVEATTKALESVG